MFFQKKRYPRVCMVVTVYGLFEYILYSTVEEVKKTYYVLPVFMWKEYGKHFQNSFCMPDRGYGDRWKNLLWGYFYLLKWIKLPSFKGAELFVHDHMPNYAVFIGRKKYTLLEDGPYCFSAMMNNNYKYSTYEEKEYEKLPIGKGRLAFLFRKIMYGPVYFNRWGKNRLCTDIVLSTDEHLDYFDKKTIHRIKLQGIWDTFSYQKQELLLNVFGMNHKDIDLIKSKKIIILTQPLYPDFIGREEHQEIWKKIITKYPIDEIIVKPHPRDQYEYEKDVENLFVFRKKIPSQLFEVLNLEFDKAVTTFSSAVFGLNANEIDWYGTEVSESITKRNIASRNILPEGFKVNFCTL